MPIILKKFALYLEKNMNLSTKTVKAYIEDILLFFSFLKYHFNLDIDVADINVFILKEVGEDTIYSFLIYLNYYQNNTASSRNRRLSAIKRFYKFLYLSYPSFRNLPNPVQNINFASKVLYVPKYINFELSKKIQTIFTKDNSRFPERNNAIITLFLQTGLRVSELVNINISDIDFKDKKAKVIVKGNFERIIYFNDYTINVIKKYLNTRNDNIDILFISSRKTRLNINSVNIICKNAFRLIGILDTTNYSAHTLRHSAASIIYHHTQDLLLTKEFLGHSNIASTQIYAHINDIDVKNAVERNPLSNFY